MQPMTLWICPANVMPVYLASHDIPWALCCVFGNSCWHLCIVYSWCAMNMTRHTLYFIVNMQSCYFISNQYKKLINFYLYLYVWWQKWSWTVYRSGYLLIWKFIKDTAEFKIMISNMYYSHKVVGNSFYNRNTVIFSLI